MGDETGVEVELAVPNTFQIFQAELARDQAWAWSWHCNLAMTVMDSTGVSHHDANVAAARLMQHLFKIDVTDWKEYQDVIARTSESVIPVEEPKLLAVDLVAPPAADENSIYITVTGFKENSGATFTARGLNELLTANGFRSTLNIADTVLTAEQVSTTDPKPGTHFAITGVESRYHTDLTSSLRDSEETGECVEVIADDVTIAEALDRDEDPCIPGDLPEEAEDLETGEGDDCDPGDPVGIEEDGAAVDDDTYDAFRQGCPTGDPGDNPEEGEESATELGRPWRNGKTKIDLIVDRCDVNPVDTIQYVEDSFPQADINVRLELDQYQTDAIHARHGVQKVIKVTLDGEDSDPARTIELLQEAFVKGFKDAVTEYVVKEGFQWKADVTMDDGQIILTNEPAPGLSLVEPKKRSLSNPEDLAGAHLLRHADGELSVQFIDTTDETFLTEVYPLATWHVEADSNYPSFRQKIQDLLGATYGEETRYIATVIFGNNEHFVNTYGDKSVEKKVIRDELDFMELEQAAIPVTLFSFLEKMWTSINLVEACAHYQTVLAQPDDDFKIAIAADAYNTFSGPGGMVYRKHPQHERLFVRLIRSVAEHQPEVHDWAVRVGIM